MMRVSLAGSPASSDRTAAANSAMSASASSSGIRSRDRSAIRSSISSARASRTRLSAADLEIAVKTASEMTDEELEARIRELDAQVRPMLELKPV